MSNFTKLGAALAATTLTLTLAACGGEDNDHEAHAEQTAANGDVFNDADVDFASAMIPHHAQALVMVDLTRGRELSPQLRQVTEDIQAAQGPEIELMTGWLTDWDQPIPETMRDHVNSGHDMDDMGGSETSDDSSDMPGMMSEEEMADLEAAQGAGFEEMWLQMMVEHHQGAIEMAQSEQEDGVFEPAIELAESIETSQQAEIDHMEELLAS
jgi:uncharacterized protein (DUF305 family)